jgi:uncharacterized protein (TIGR00296 family)
MISLQKGAFLVKLARKAVTEYLKGNGIIKPIIHDPDLNIKRGVFTTIEAYNIIDGTIYKELRGCIGFPFPYEELYLSVIKSAILAATEDFRFPPLKANELNNVVFEISILTEPKLIDVEKKKLISMIKVGKDGLIIEHGFSSGLLLPQVAVENKWDSETFLCNACLKAGLPPDAWLWKNTKVYTFQAEIFGELQPNSKVIKKEIEKSVQ